MDEKEPKKEMKFEQDADEVKDVDIETSDSLGGLSGLSLSLD